MQKGHKSLMYDRYHFMILEFFLDDLLYTLIRSFRVML